MFILDVYAQASQCDTTVCILGLNLKLPNREPIRISV